MDQQPVIQPPHRPDEYQAASQSMKDYMSQVAPMQQAKRKRHTGWITTLVILAIVVVGAGAYWFTSMRTTDEPQPNPQPVPPAATSELLVAEVTDYTSANLSLSFEYPEDWDVEEAADTGILTVASPAGKLTDAQGKTVDGQVIVSIRPKPAELTEFASGNAMAAVESEKIAYTRPSSSQRGETYLSFLTFAQSTNGALDGVYITGDTGYQAGQAVPMADLVPVEPIINVSFVKCPDGSCPVVAEDKLSLDAAAWKDSPLLQQAKALLQSLTIR